VATGTKTLQHQAFNKDVPQVREFLGLSEDELKIKLLVGSNNHFCESLFRQEEGENTLMGLSRTEEELFASLYFECIFFHNNRLKSSDKILRDDLPYVLKKKIEAIGKETKKLLWILDPVQVRIVLLKIIAVILQGFVKLRKPISLLAITH